MRSASRSPPARLDTDIEVDYYANGGILPYVLRKMVREG
jgi:aconitase A